MVVNCFQKLLPSWWRTTKLRRKTEASLLWIAFKNYYLRDEGQHLFFLLLRQYSCELLSKIITFVMKDNIPQSIHLPTIVVNCFQKLLSSWWRTTTAMAIMQLWVLWIAFKNYYLRDEGQLLPGWNIAIRSCELLSKIIIFVMKDNKRCLYE